MNVLFIYPEFPNTFWSFKHALKFVFKKSGSQPLGLLTVSSLLPEDWNKELVDLNAGKLTEKKLTWADMIFLGGMSVQKDSMKEVLKKCEDYDVRVVAGGSFFTVTEEDYPEVDHFVLDEAEITLPEFLDDLEKGDPKRIYRSDEWADMTESPLPDWDLINVNDYATLNIQYSRGCPMNCDFCDITVLCGRTQRTKTREQILNELDAIYDRGWRGPVFFVDDNFIGNKNKLKEDILPAISGWMEKKDHPFTLLTQASIGISDDDELIELMVDANFNRVFVGIETPNEESLSECSKHQNKNRDLVADVKKLHKNGLQVQGGFIVGFDSDPKTIFDTQIKFIQKSGIVTAMVGLLNVIPKTDLYKRLKKENRLLQDSTGDNTDFSLNFIPKMDYDDLIDGYKKIVDTIYSPSHYYKRVKKFLRDYNPLREKSFNFSLNHIWAFLKSTVYLGVIGKERFHYWELLLWTAFKKPKLLPLAIRLSIYGYHFRKVFEK